MRLKTFALIAAILVLAAVTVAVFIAFDSTSHSASDTIRPFLLTMAPVWAAFGVTIWAVSRTRVRRSNAR